MNKFLGKKLFPQSVLSFAVLVVFLLFALGTGPERKKEDLGSGVYRITTEYEKCRIILTGKCNYYGTWHGPFTKEYEFFGSGTNFKESVEMRNGLRHGKATYTYEDGRVIYKCYRNGLEVDYINGECVYSNYDYRKAAQTQEENPSAFAILQKRYSRILQVFNAFQLNNEYVEAYLDTLELSLSTYIFEITEFDLYYQEVIDSLEKTPYDSIISLNSDLSYDEGIEAIKKSEFRMAEIDRYYSDGNSTYDIVQKRYPNYLLSLNTNELSNQDFELFCNEMDSIMNSYGELDTGDPFFIDSVDNRIYMALSTIIDAKKSMVAAFLSKKSTAEYLEITDLTDKIQEIYRLSALSILTSSPSDVGLVVLSLILQELVGQDMVKESVREAYLIRQGIARIPTVTTEFSGNPTANNAILRAYIFQDGGAEVTSRGIAWADFYNPTINDNIENGGMGIGEFSVTLTGLEEGKTYYARSFAINSAGIAYGNCISLVAGSNVGIEDMERLVQEFSIYPNPAPGYATFRFNLESTESMTLIFFNLKGQQVLSRELSELIQGENHVELNLSELPDGIYTIWLTHSGHLEATGKLILGQ